MEDQSVEREEVNLQWLRNLKNSPSNAWRPEDVDTVLMIVRNGRGTDPLTEKATDALTALIKADEDLALNLQDALAQIMLRKIRCNFQGYCCTKRGNLWKVCELFCCYLQIWSKSTREISRVLRRAVLEFIQWTMGGKDAFVYVYAAKLAALFVLRDDCLDTCVSQLFLDIAKRLESEQSMHLVKAAAAAIAAEKIICLRNPQLLKTLMGETQSYSTVERQQRLGPVIMGLCNYIFEGFVEKRGEWIELRLGALELMVILYSSHPSWGTTVKFLLPLLYTILEWKNGIISVRLAELLTEISGKVRFSAHEFQEAGLVQDTTYSLRKAVRDADSELVHATLNLLSRVMVLNDDARTQCLDNRLLQIVFVVLGWKHTVRPRLAACRFLRALSRSVAVLYRGLIPIPLLNECLKVVEDSEENVELRSEALAVLCNCVLEFSAVRKYLLRMHLQDLAVGLLAAEDADLRLNAVWLLTHIAYNAPRKFKKSMTLQLGTHIYDLLGDKNPIVVDRAMKLLQNLTSDNPSGVDILNAKRLVGTLDTFCNTRKIVPATRSAVYTLANIAKCQPLSSYIIYTRTALMKRMCAMFHEYYSERGVEGLIELAFTLMNMHTAIANETTPKYAPCPKGDAEPYFDILLPYHTTPRLKAKACDIIWGFANFEPLRGHS